MMGLLLKSACVLCGDTTSNVTSLCDPCKIDLSVINHACKQCGLPLNSENESICGQCVQAPPAIDYTVSLYHYETPIDFLITALKYKQQLSHAAILSQLLLEFLQRKAQENALENLPDCILPVPLYKSRLIKRGFNQSLEIARPVAKELNIPIELKIVKRKRQTRAQTELTALERQKNVRGCFELISNEIINYKHIVIIDDVVTTGSTVNELAKLLKKSGVETVGVWSIARAVIY